LQTEGNDGSTELMTVALFAGIRVHDVAAARRWYERLLGEPSFFPHATEAVWTLADERSVYIVEDAKRAGHGVVTIFVDDLDDPDDLDAVVAGIAFRDGPLGSREQPAASAPAV
jgi:hypothetical protein